MVRMIRKPKSKIYVSEDNLGQTKNVIEFQYFDAPDAPNTWNPNMDIFETEEDVVIMIEAAGLDEDSVRLHAMDNRLVLAGERRLEMEDSIIQYHQLEIQFMPFQKTIIIPGAIDVDKVRAKYRNGMLTISVSKRYLEGNSEE